MVLIWIFVCFDTKWMNSIFKEIATWIGDFRYIRNYFLPMIFSEKFSEKCQTKMGSEFSRISCCRWNYSNLALHNIFLIYIIYCRLLQKFTCFYKILRFHLSCFLHIYFHNCFFKYLCHIKKMVSFFFIGAWTFSISKNICSKCFYSFICWLSLFSNYF